VYYFHDTERDLVEIHPIWVRSAKARTGGFPDANDRRTRRFRHCRSVGDVVAVPVRDQDHIRLCGFAFAGNDGLPVYHGSHNTVLPPGVRTTKEE
jgi:hypothetical protein